MHGQDTWDRLEDLRLAREVATWGLKRQRGRFLFDGGLVYRGDSRHPSEVFATGFRVQPILHLGDVTGLEYMKDDVDFAVLRILKRFRHRDPARYDPAISNLIAKLSRTYEHLFRRETHQSGEKVLFGISTTTHLPMAFEYGEGGFVYAIDLRGGGLDFTDVSPNLLEINAVNIDPQDIIAAAGPLVDVSEGPRYGEQDPGRHRAERLFVNPKNTVDSTTANRAIEALHGQLEWGTRDDSFL